MGGTSDLMPEVLGLAQTVNALGVVGILIFLVLAFYRGDIISRNVYEKMTDKLVESFVRHLEDKFKSFETYLKEIETEAEKQREPRGRW
jgi:hypothetical protein